MFRSDSLLQEYDAEKYFSKKECFQQCKSIPYHESPSCLKFLVVFLCKCTYLCNGMWGVVAHGHLSCQDSAKTKKAICHGMLTHDHYVISMVKPAVSY